MKKIIITSFLSLTALTTIPMFGMIETKVSKDTSMSVATPSEDAKESTAEGEKRIRAAVEEALKSFKIDPKSVTIAVEKMGEVNGQCDSENRIIHINEDLSDSDLSNKLTWVAYHETAHLSDQIYQKATLAGFFCTALGFTVPTIARLCFCQKPLTSGLWGTGFLAVLGACASYLAFKTLGGEAYCFRQGELRADRLAVEHLLREKKYFPVVTILGLKLGMMAEGLDEASKYTPSSQVACDFIMKCVRDNGFIISFVRQEKNLSTLEKALNLPFKPQSAFCLLKGKQQLAYATTRLKWPQIKGNNYEQIY